MDKIKYALELARIVLVTNSNKNICMVEDAIMAINEALGKPKQKYINNDY